MPCAAESLLPTAALAFFGVPLQIVNLGFHIFDLTSPGFHIFDLTSSGFSLLYLISKAMLEVEILT